MMTLPDRVNFAAKEIYEGMRIPKWYGVAYWAMDRNVAVCYPVPFNWLARWAREVVLRLKCPPAQRDLKAFTRGLNEGRALGDKYGFERGYRDRGMIEEQRTAALKQTLERMMQHVINLKSMRPPNVVIPTETVCRVCGEREAIAPIGSAGGSSESPAPGQPAPGTEGDRLATERAESAGRDAAGEDVREGLPAVD